MKHGYNFQHAENGGEYYIKELGYFLDAYDLEKNVVLEIDESHHFRNGKLRKKDIIRQEEITNFLGCKFIRKKI
jgi:very-short-patch-repair endonuclease